ncbi:hypothetical protein BM1_03610 [Bipolaris maydis]|uniref:uncharacterized protein n=1 Tax=Cochliobolus heterostrophus TaxID=5016 RepID=UPI0024CF0991|nr:hypothetical protein BM1_03610 [Bipolaris maydis]KAJ5022578.1 hypothetical protein J3E73DRAFT_260744 [Bipolaris maydis]KAJ5064753.1 hypothetical protein J3E74DRAFT_287362 [Bipolaris maydis]KAJ6267826.1 hypothetical protein PSV08DRAFT_250130 [Bipolaris maydis]KAJ6277071.1 hypothetical protein J3E71DRAFT_245001 [Bipolaris maydis]
MKAFFVTLVVLPAALPSSQAAKQLSNLKRGIPYSGAGVYLPEFRWNNQGFWTLPTHERLTPWPRRVGTSSTPAMNTIFNNEKCVQQWGSEWSKGVCRPVSLCQGAGGPDYYKIC